MCRNKLREWKIDCRSASSRNKIRRLTNKVDRRIWKNVAQEYDYEEEEYKDYLEIYGDRYEDEEREVIRKLRRLAEFDDFIDETGTIRYSC